MVSGNMDTGQDARLKRLPLAGDGEGTLERHRTGRPAQFGDFSEAYELTAVLQHHPPDGAK